MTAPLYFDTLAPLLVSRLLYSVAEGTMLALSTWVLLRFVRRPGSGTRFAVWFSVLLATALLPLWGGFSYPSASIIPSATASARPLLELPPSWAGYIFAAWLTVTGVALLRLGIGVWQIRRLRRDCVVLSSAELDPAVREVLQRFRSIRPVELCISSRAQVPAAIGFFHSRVVIPAWLLKELSPGDLRQLVLHELAHLRRWDDWTNLVQKVLRALLFFHPVVWWLDSRVALEREMACDDCVVAETSNPRAYAECLAFVAERSYLRRYLALAQAAVSRIRHTSRRVARILNADGSGATRISKPALGMVTALSLACLVLQAHTPELVGFRTILSQPRSTAITATSDRTVPPQMAGAHVVPVMARRPPQLVTAKTTAPSHSSTLAAAESLKSTHSKRRPVALPARLALPAQRTTRSQLLSARVTSPLAAAAEQNLLVIVEDEQYGSSVHMLQVLVLRVSLVSPPANPVVKAKAI